jgi:4'-phosphopantetheinyl transferase
MRRLIADSNFAAGHPLSLADNEVHLWGIDLDGVATGETRWRTVLSPDELARADRFHFARDRQNFTATRALLRMVLGDYLRCDPSKLTFLYSDKGRPVLSANHSSIPVQFNVSHSGARAVLAFSVGRDIGVDVERIRHDLDCDLLAERYFSLAEQKALAALPLLERCSGFFRCWTRKEAYIKAHGAGLSLPLDSFDVSITGGEKNALLATRPDAAEAARWSLSEVDAGEGYAAALSVKGHGWVLKD